MKGSSDGGFIIPTGQEKKKNEKNPGSAEKRVLWKDDKRQRRMVLCVLTVAYIAKYRVFYEATGKKTESKIEILHHFR